MNLKIYIDMVMYGVYYAIYTEPSYIPRQQRYFSFS